MRLASLGFATTLMLAGCGGGETAPAPSNAAVPAVPAATPTSQATGAPAKSKAISYDVDKVEFHYSWPGEAAGIPALDSWLSGNGDQLKKRTLDGARNEQASAKKDGYPFNGYSYSEDWAVAADTPALLILQSDGYAFTGGAHGMPIVTTLFWDKVAGKRLATGAIFDMPGLIAATKDRFCKALDAERSKRRGAPVDASDPDELSDFVQCVDPAKQTILPIATKAGTLDMLRFVIMPYEAGPYAEGIYILDLPIDAAMLKAVKPAYKASFSAAR